MARYLHEMFKKNYYLIKKRQTKISEVFSGDTVKTNVEIKAVRCDHCGGDDLIPY